MRRRPSQRSPGSLVLLVPAFLSACTDTRPPGVEVDGSGGALGSGGVPGSGGGASTGGGTGVGGTLSTGGGTVGSGGASGGTLAASGGSSGSGGDTATGGTGATGPDFGGAPGVADPDWTLINGVQWADTDGNPIQAHGGGVIKVGQDYFWFGENRNPDGTFYAVSAYRSRDLMQWEFRNHVLTEASDPELDPANIERPKVVYNESTGKYVMWMHWENGMDYGEARAAVASSDTVDGDYTYHGSFRPYQDQGVTDHGKPGYMSRDCTLFADDDGTGYFLSATNENYDLNLYRLTPDYLAVDELVETLFPGGHREAPALFKRFGTYYLITSGATGWDPNQAQYTYSDDIASGWASLANIGDGSTFNSQSTYVVELGDGGSSSVLYMGDRWAGAYGGPVNDSTYVWQPISFGPGDQISMSWNDTIDVDAENELLDGTVEDFYLVNVKSGFYLGVEGDSLEDGADVVQRAAGPSDSMVWAFDYTGSGAFRITNKNSGKVLDVPDESTEDGILLGQWEGNGGDHQAFIVVDIGQGRYLVRNQNSGKYVGVVGGSTTDGADIEQRSATGGDEQIWLVRGNAPDDG